MQRFLRFLLVVLPALAMASCGGIPKTSIVSVPDGTPIASVDDSLLARVLERAIAPNGAVSYTELRSDSELTEYLREIALVRTDAFVSRAELLAFWMNAHNAYVLDLIRSNGPAHSLDDIPGFQYAKVVIAGGKSYSLDDIEHAVIEKQFREPRAFFGLFEGSRSSPELARTPFSESELSDELDFQLRNFLADSTKNYLDRRTNTLYLSPLFKEYESSLEAATGGSMLAFIRDFAPPQMAEWIAGHPHITISYLRSDNTIFTSDIEPHHEPSHERTYAPAPRRTPGGIR